MSEAKQKTGLQVVNGTAGNGNAGQQQGEVTIDLMALMQELIRRIWILILCAVIGGAAAGIYTHCCITPQYEASSMIYIYTKTTSITSLTDLQIGTQLTNDFQIIATTREVLEAVIEKLELPTTYEKLKNQVTISTLSSSRILQITVQDPNPEKAAATSNALANELRHRIAEIMSTDEPSIVEKAVVPTSPVSPSMLKNVAVGAAIMLLLAVAVITIRFITNDTVRTEDDITEHLGLSVLAVIPYTKAMEEKSSSASRSEAKNTKKAVGTK